MTKHDETSAADERRHTERPEQRERPERAGLDAIRGSFLSLTTYRRDGSAVATPVWFAADGDRLVVLTGANSGKVKRLHRNPNVLVATCSARGRVLGPTLEARAAILPKTNLDRVKTLIQRRYRIAVALLRPIRAIQVWRHPERRREVALEITSPPSTSGDRWGSCWTLTTPLARGANVEARPETRRELIGI
jgi:PPOX class probable F420-dependent enzyme